MAAHLRELGMSDRAIAQALKCERQDRRQGHCCRSLRLRVIRLRNPTPHSSNSPVLEIKDSSAGCGLGCPHSDEEYPRREPFSEATAVAAPRRAPKGPATPPDEPPRHRTRDQSQRLRSHRRRAARASIPVATRPSWSSPPAPAAVHASFVAATALVRPRTGQEAKAIAGDVRRLGAKRGARRPLTSFSGPQS